MAFPGHRACREKEVGTQLHVLKLEPWFHLKVLCRDLCRLFVYRSGGDMRKEDIASYRAHVSGNTEEKRMFSCCLPSCGGSGFRKAKKKSLFSHYRHWLRPHLHRLWPIGRRNTQTCTQEVLEELADGFGYSICLDRGQQHCATINHEGFSEREGESSFCLTEAYRMHALQTGRMEHLSESPVPAFPGRVTCSGTTSTSNYLVFGTTHRVLDQLFPK
nr:uncharacterized protein LOC123281838 [Equus asinus]